MGRPCEYLRPHVCGYAAALPPEGIQAFLGRPCEGLTPVGNRIVPALLIALLLIVHAQLWIGRGSISNVNNMQRKLSEQTVSNAQAQADNERLDAEVKDLKEGLEMVEEKAREELGMVKPNEIFVQIAK